MDSVAGQSWLETPPATEPNPSQGSSPFRAGGSGSKMARAHGYQRGAGCWQEASVLLQGGPFSELLFQCLLDTVAAFPQSKQFRRESQSFYALTQKSHNLTFPTSC